MTSMAEWAPLLRDQVVDHYVANYGLDPTGRIGNPAVAGTFQFCGLEVHVDHGGDGGYALYETVEPWPTARQDYQRHTPRTAENDAADFLIRVLDCVPQRNEDGTIPDATEYDASVLYIQDLGQGLFDAMRAGRQQWRGDGTGYVHFDGIRPIPRQGTHAGWEIRVVCEVC